MKISEFPNAIYIGDIVHHHSETGSKKHVRYKRKLSLTTLPEHKKIVKEKLAICYFMVVNGEVMKIGQTSGEDGLHSCMGFYGIAGLDDPSQTRFGINFLMREEMEKGNVVQIWMQYDEPFEHKFMGAIGPVTKMVLMSPKEIEEDCIKYHLKMTSKFPVWNFQEDGSKQSMPVRIKEAFADYTNRRKGKV